VETLEHRLDDLLGGERLDLGQANELGDCRFHPANGTA